MNSKSFLTLIMRLSVYFLPLMMFSACHDTPRPDNPDDEVSRTVLVYMVANNDLGQNGFATDDLREMMSAVNAGALGKNGRLLVYRNSHDGEPDRLVELLPDSVEQLLVTYSGDGLLSIDVERMRRVISDSRSIAPAESYGIVFWSHGTGWIEETSSRGPQRSFGLDNRKRMKITSLAEALRPTPFDWIYFDCCHMGVAEVLYELRDAARTIVASTPELPVEGMPYDVNIFEFFKSDADMVKAASNTYDYYMTDPRATTRSLGIAVYDMDKFEALASATADIMSSGLSLPDDYVRVRYGRGSLASTIFDMRDYIMALGPESSLLARWQRAYDDAVVYHASTPVCYGLDMSKFTGMGCYIVEGRDDIVRGYENYQWYRDVTSLNPNLK